MPRRGHPTHHGTTGAHHWSTRSLSRRTTWHSHHHPLLVLLLHSHVWSSHLHPLLLHSLLLHHVLLGIKLLLLLLLVWWHSLLLLELHLLHLGHGMVSCRPHLRTTWHGGSLNMNHALLTLP